MRGPAKQRSGAMRVRDERALYAAFATLKSAAEVERFLRDIATPAEIEAFAERWRIARLLDGDVLSYRDIAAETGASTATVARVARFLRADENRGYRIALDRSSRRTGRRR